MADPSIVNPGDSSYSLPSPTDSKVGDIPQANLDKVLPRQVSTGLSRGVQQLGSPNIYVDSGNNNIIVADSVGQGILPRVLMGSQVNKGDGFYVTKPGIDVTSANSDADFIFNSNQNVFKIVGVIVGDVIVPSSPPTGVSVTAHGLGYTPVVIGFIQFNPGSYSPMGVHSVAYTGANSGKVAVVSYLYVDAVNVTVQMDFPDWSGHSTASYSYKVYMLQETAN